MTVKQAIETVRIALGDRDDHHPNCDTRKKPKGECDCYCQRRQVPHKALDLIEKALKAGGSDER